MSKLEHQNKIYLAMPSVILSLLVFSHIVAKQYVQNNMYDLTKPTVTYDDTLLMISKLAITLFWVML